MQTTSATMAEDSCPNVILSLHHISYVYHWNSAAIAMEEMFTMQPKKHWLKSRIPLFSTFCKKGTRFDEGGITGERKTDNSRGKRAPIYNQVYVKIVNRIFPCTHDIYFNPAPTKIFIFLKNLGKKSTFYIRTVLEHNLLFTLQPFFIAIVKEWKGDRGFVVWPRLFSFPK